MPQYEQAHQASSNHREAILASDQCGCYYCLRIFPPGEIEEWVEGDNTALCPYCGIDTVIGDASGIPITEDFLSQMRERYF